MRFAYVYFMTDDPDRVRRVAPDHAAYWRELHLDGYQGGPFADRSGGLIIFAAESAEHADQLDGGSGGWTWQQRCARCRHGHRRLAVAVSYACNGWKASWVWRSRSSGGGTSTLARLAPVVAAVVLLTLAVFGLAVITGIDRAQARLPRHEARVVVAYRFVVPLVAEAILTVGAVAMIAGARLGVSSPAAFVVLMFVVGTENAWDLLLGTGRSPHDPHRQAYAHGYRCLARPVRQLRNGSFVRSRMDRVVRAA